MPSKIKKLCVSKHLCDNLKFIKILAKNNPKRIKSLIKKASTDQLLTLVEIAFNLLRSRIPIVGQKRLYRKLCAKAPFIRRLSLTSTPESARSLLLQAGGGFPFIAGLLASTVVPLLAEAISKKYLSIKK